MSNNLTSVEAALMKQGSSLNTVLLAAPSIVLFGSRAAGCASNDSDWDIALIGTTQRLRVATFDFVNVRDCSSKWHRTELATHIKHFGIWLQGTAPTSWHLDYALAFQRKHRVIETRLAALFAASSHLTARRRVLELIDLRRDLQRLQRLRLGQPVPPRQHLDLSWHHDTSIDNLCHGTDICVHTLQTLFAHVS